MLKYKRLFVSCYFFKVNYSFYPGSFRYLKDSQSVILKRTGSG